jgi:hypothetical protein
MMKVLTCVDCRVEFTYDHRTGPTRQRCDTCTKTRKHATDSAKAKRWRDENRERAREQWNRYNRKRLADPEHRRRKRDDFMRRAYGLTPADFEALLASQAGGCAICGGGAVGPGTRLHIDHCHNSSRVRGLLCGKCNTAIGLLDDNAERAEQLARYLRAT